MRSRHIAASIIGIGMIVGITLGAIFMPAVAIALAIVGFITLGIIFSMGQPSHRTVTTLPATTTVTTTPIVATPVVAAPVFSPTPIVTVVQTPAVTVVRREPNLAAAACFGTAGLLFNIATRHNHHGHHHHKHPYHRHQHHGHHYRGYR